MRLFEVNSGTQPVVYLDMDGVLADFFGQVAQDHGVEHWSDIKRGEIAIEQSAKKDGFFTKLPVLKNAHKLINAVVAIAGNYSILSSPLQSRVESSAEEKSEWLRHHFEHYQPQAVIFDHEKFKFARQSDGTPNVLIDDYPMNLYLWRQHGGIAIHYDDSKADEVIRRFARYWTNHKDYQSDYKKIPMVTESIDRLFTNLDILGYVKGLHHKYTLDDPIRKVKAWKLVHVPTSFCCTPEYNHQDDPFRRNINLDWEHIKTITLKDIMTKPAVATEDGWVLDGNHRVTAARLHGLEEIPLIVPA